MEFTITNTIDVNIHEIYNDWEGYDFSEEELNGCVKAGIEYATDGMGDISEKDMTAIIKGAKEAVMQEYYDVHAVDEQKELQELIDKIVAHGHRIRVDDEYEVHKVEVLKE